MIALALLAMGLLVIGAALPIGVRYTRDSVDLSTGQAAARYALTLIEQNVCLRRTILDASKTLIHEPVIFQPRDSNGLPAKNAAGGEWVPLIAVRPLFARSIQATPGYPQRELVPPTDPVSVEDCLGNWLGSWDSKECAWSASKFALWPALPSVAFVYPPITRDTPLLPGDCIDFTNAQWKDYSARPVLTSPAGAEAKKALEQRVSWTAFYRRVGYGPNSDPTLYEFIVVATRLPSERHRFPVQPPASAGQATVTTGARAGAAAYGQVADTAAPIPWLVTFADPLPAPTGGPSNPATLVFQLSIGAGGRVPYDGLFPVGTIFIPARNDDEQNLPSGLTGANPVGFWPAAPTVLPIFEVTERPDATTVVTKFNGYYPHDISTNKPPLANQWPVWVIPPAFEQLDSNGDPVFSNRSPVLAVARRYIRLREAP